MLWQFYGRLLRISKNSHSTAASGQLFYFPLIVVGRGGCFYIRFFLWEENEIAGQERDKTTGKETGG